MRGRQEPQVTTLASPQSRGRSCTGVPASSAALAPLDRHPDARLKLFVSPGLGDEGISP